MKQQKINVIRNRVAGILLVLISLCLVLSVTVSATDVGFDERYERLSDAAELMSEGERATLAAKIDEIRTRQNFDIAVVTVNTTSGLTAMEYADTYYESSAFGYGSDRSGVLLLIDMETHEWWISTCGYGITAFTDAGIDYIGEKITAYFSDGRYAEGFGEFAELCDEFVTQARSGEPFDTKNLPREPLSAVWILISLLVGLVVASIIVGGMKNKLKTVRANDKANSYLKADSLNITESREMFLYRTVTRTAKAQQSNNDSGSSGGSSTHQSSSGTTHGGGGGKF